MPFPQAPKARRGQKARKATTDRPGPKAMTARKVQPALKVQMVRWDRKAHKVRKVILAALKVHPDPKAMTDPQGRKAFPVK